MFTEQELQNMTIKDAQNYLENELYLASAIIEQLEYVKSSKGGKRIGGNGHHIRQRIAKLGSDLLAERWQE